MSRDMAAVIVDDERLARSELRTLLAAHPEIRVIGEAASVQSAAEVIARKRPDLVFLDIQLGAETGFDLLELLDAQLAVIFVTAYEQHAIRAFEVNALDYLLKPVTPERLAAAIDKLEALKPPSALKQPLQYQDRLLIRLEHGMAFHRIDHIKYIEVAGDYSYLHAVNGKKHLVHKPLKEWEARLPSGWSRGPTTATWSTCGASTSRSA